MSDWLFSIVWILFHVMLPAAIGLLTPWWVTTIAFVACLLRIRWIGKRAEDEDVSADVACAHWLISAGILFLAGVIKAALAFF